MTSLLHIEHARAMAEDRARAAAARQQLPRPERRTWPVGRLMSRSAIRLSRGARRAARAQRLA